MRLASMVVVLAMGAAVSVAVCAPSFHERAPAADGVDHAATALYFEGHRMAKQSRHAEAVALYSRAIEMRPGHHEIYLHRAYANYYLRQWGEMERDYSIYLAARPGDAYLGSGTFIRERILGYGSHFAFRISATWFVPLYLSTSARSR